MVDYRNADISTIVQFGDVEIDEGIVSCQVNLPTGKPNTAEVEISDEVLVAANPDYQAEARVLYSINGERFVRFTGFVVTVEPRDGETLVSMASGLLKMEEQMLGGLAFSGVGAGEVLWSMLRSTGRDPAVIDIEGFEPGPLEVFEVATTLDGVTVDESTPLGEVSLLPSGPVSRVADGQKELEERYAGGSAWAFVLVTARTLFDAEAEGLRLIDASLAWLAARTRYSGAVLPGGTTRRFRRDWTRARVYRRDVVFTRGVSTGRWWLRHPYGIADRPNLALPEVNDIDRLPLPPNLSPQMREAFSAWRRAAEETDPLAAVVALWECAEFYVSGVSVDDLFTKAERKAVRKKAIEGLQGEQLQKVRDVMGWLNEAPLMTRLREALKQDGVPYGEGELALLKKLRKIRNDFVHGRSRELPSEVDLRHATAVVNRILMHGVAKWSGPPTKEEMSGSVADFLRQISEPKK